MIFRQKSFFCCVLILGSLVSTAQAQSSEGSQGYTLPESYYNSLKNQPEPIPTNSAPVSQAPTVPQNEAESQQPTLSPSQSTSEERSPQIGDYDDIAPSLMHLGYQREMPLPAEFNVSFLRTELGQIQAELEMLKTRIEDGNKTAGYNGGFFIQSADKKFKLKFNGRLRFRYSFIFPESVEAAHTFSRRNTNLIISGHTFTDKLTYFFFMDPASGNSLLLGKMTFKVNPLLSVIVGTDGAIFDYGAGSPGGSFMYPGIAFSRFYALGGGTGVAFTGSKKWFSYFASVYNGIDNGSKINANTELGYAAKVDFTILDGKDKPTLIFGAGGAFSNFDNTTIAGKTQGRFIGATLGMTFGVGRFQLNAFGLYRQIDPSNTDFAQIDISASLAADYDIIPGKLKVGARVSAIFDDLRQIEGTTVRSTGEPRELIAMYAGNPTRMGGNISGGDVDGDAANEWEYTLGMTYNFYGGKARLQAQYIFMVDGRNIRDSLYNHIGLAQIHVGF